RCKNRVQASEFLVEQLAECRCGIVHPSIVRRTRAMPRVARRGNNPTEGHVFMTRISTTRTIAAALLGVLATSQFSVVAEAQQPQQAMMAREQAMNARAQAAKIQMMKMKQAQAAQAGMAAATVTAATLAATGAGECSPYLAK